MDNPPEIEEMLVSAEAKCTELHAANERQVMAIAQMGAMIGPEMQLRIRLDTFIAFMFDRAGANLTPEIRKLMVWQFETAFEEHVHDALDEVQSEVRKAMMGAAGSLSEKDIRQMWDWQQHNGHGGGGPRGHG